MTDSFFDRKPWLDPIFYFTVPIRILIVTDDEGSFSPQHRFSMTELIRALDTLESLTVSFQITTAHRLDNATDDPTQAGPNDYSKDAKWPGFRFTDARFRPQDFDEIWFFGVSAGHADYFKVVPLSEDELRIVTEFMNAGGGVFATGDHESLGQPLCGHLPRVRSMRRWNFDYSKVSNSYNDFDESSGDAPPSLGRYRHDTTVSGANIEYTFDDQSDDIPAAIEPVYYSFGNYLVRGSYPHPLLCLPNGVLDVLPDHMHEGLIEVPEKLDTTYSFAGLTGDEYPASPGGGRVAPQIVAYINAIGGHKTRLEVKDLFGGQPGQTNESTHLDVPVFAEKYGAIGVYDGHYPGVGRVVVDSTFHHFFNLNLIGTASNSNDPIKRMGFNASAAGRAHYAKIQDYYRNIGLWLAPKALQKTIFERALWVARWDSQLKMQAPTTASGLRGWADVVQFGRSVKEALFRLHPPCFVRGWSLSAIDPDAILLPNDVYVDFNRPYPPPYDYRQALFSAEDVINAALAGMMTSLMQASPMRTFEVRRAVEGQLGEIVQRGAMMGLRATTAFYRRGLEQTQRFFSLLEDSGGSIDKYPGEPRT